jgi:two-component system, OmpR family, response regulator ChvI
MANEEGELSFSNESLNCCVSFVDMVSSTKTTANIGDNYQKVAKYYCIFLNTMALIVKKFEGTIIKNAGDSLIYYFLKTSNYTDKQAFKNVIECGITMLAAFHYINSKMSEEGLPFVSYRISSDYGRSIVAKSFRSTTFDLFGPTMNVCAKINSMATPNSNMVIGGDLYQIIKSFPSFFEDYRCEMVGQSSVTGLKQAYPVYSIVSRYQQPLKSEQLSFFSYQKNSTLDAATTGEKHDVTTRESAHNNILVVDDESDTLYTYKSLLEEEGYKVDTFSNPEEALKHFAQTPTSYYNLVLLDIRMPRLNGLQLYYRMKSIEMNIQIIFVSALDAAEELVSILPGISLDKHIIKKPIKRELFLDKIEDICCHDHKEEQQSNE